MILQGLERYFTGVDFIVIIYYSLFSLGVLLFAAKRIARRLDESSETLAFRSTYAYLGRLSIFIFLFIVILSLSASSYPVETNVETKASLNSSFDHIEVVDYSGRTPIVKSSNLDVFITDYSNVSKIIVLNSNETKVIYSKSFSYEEKIDYKNEPVEVNLGIPYQKSNKETLNYQKPNKERFTLVILDNNENTLEKKNLTLTKKDTTKKGLLSPLSSFIEKKFSLE